MAKVLFVSTAYENLGIEYISAFLKLSGHEVSLIIDPCLFLNPYQKNNFLGSFFSFKSGILKKVENLKPDLVCFSVMTDTYQWALDLAKSIKERINTNILFGGIHPTILPELAIKEDSVDFVCVGEGEEAVLELSNKIHNPDSCLDIANIWAKKSGKIIENVLRPYFDNLDILPFPDKELFYQESRIYSKEYFTMVGRGCEYSCSFCCNQVFKRIYGNNYVRRRSVENVIKELSFGKDKYQFSFVWFMDDNFTSDCSWLKEFSKEYKRHIRIPFFCYSHPNNMSSEVAVMLKEANCQEVAIGVESINPHTCSLMDRRVNKETIKESLGSIKSARIFSAVENILGFPYEEEKDIINLVKFYNENRPNLIIFSWLKVFPGTKIFNLLKADKLITDKQANDMLNGKDNSLVLGGNFRDKKVFNNSSCLLALVPFLPVSLVNLIVKRKIYEYFGFLNPSLILRMIRMFRGTNLAKALMGNKDYDAGAKISLRIYSYFIGKRIKTIFNKI